MRITLNFNLSLNLKIKSNGGVDVNLDDAPWASDHVLLLRALDAWEAAPNRSHFAETHGPGRPPGIY